MPKSPGKPKPIEAHIEPAPSEQPQEIETHLGSQDSEPLPEADNSPGTTQTDDWWSAPQPSTDWTEPAPEVSAQTAEVAPLKEPSADVYFCGPVALLSLNRALQAIAKEKLTGTLRVSWEKEPVELLAREGEIVLVTTRDVDLYCAESPALLADADPAQIERARAEQSETGIPFLLGLAREGAIASDAAAELVQRYGQKLFSHLWTASEPWVAFEKNAPLLEKAADLSGDPDVSDWALATLRLVENLDVAADFDPTSIPGYTKEGFERIQRLKLTSDEAQFASQFNGVRSVQQIAKNLRLDLKSTRQMLFRFLALEIVECWPASSVAKPEPSGGLFQRFGRSGRRGH
jgi:hypothetical protein